MSRSFFNVFKMFNSKKDKESNSMQLDEGIDPTNTEFERKSFSYDTKEETNHTETPSSEVRHAAFNAISKLTTNSNSR